MDKVIMVGCDLHDENLLVQFAEGRGEPETRSFGNTGGGRRAMETMLKKRAEELDGARIVFAYEASAQGFGLYDELTELGIEAHVLAPSLIPRSPNHRTRKTDERDARQVFEVLRAHVLAGNELPEVWIPDDRTRDDRELVRGRLDVTEKVSAVKTQVRTLLKRSGVRKPKDVGRGWTQRCRAWLGELVKRDGPLRYGARLNLGSLLRQMEALEGEAKSLDEEIAKLAETPRYAEPVRELLKLKGVGVLVAMVFLTEMGDLSRFSNRKQIGAYLGIVPTSDESGETDDRKGHITHQGSPRVRKALCQAVWARVRTDAEEMGVYARIVRRNPKHKKIAVVACMRRLAVRMWHKGLEAQKRAGCFSGVTSGVGPGQGEADAGGGGRR
jgi:transposase